MPVKDGGPAFPIQFGIYDKGMSLRDWFAGMALQGLYASGDVTIGYEHNCLEAYKIADAMIAEREKEKS
jgi:hypothetical protein